MSQFTWPRCRCHDVCTLTNKPQGTRHAQPSVLLFIPHIALILLHSYTREKYVGSIFGDMVSIWYISCCFVLTPCEDPLFLYIFYDSLDLCKPSENKTNKISYMYHRQSRARNPPRITVATLSHYRIDFPLGLGTGLNLTCRAVNAYSLSNFFNLSYCLVKLESSAVARLVLIILFHQSCKKYLYKEALLIPENVNQRENMKFFRQLTVQTRTTL
jgi:hypothetical protein